MKRRIFVVDDHPIIRHGYASLVNGEIDLEICGEAGSAAEAMEKLPKARPDLVIVDISMEGLSGIELVKRIESRWPNMAVLVVSMHDESLYAERALRAGARGYVMKSEVDVVVIKAIRKILHGGVYISDRMSTKILMHFSGRNIRDQASPIEQLSDRELEVFEHIGRGMATRHIAETLHISPKTVQTHRGRIKEKLDIESTAELVQRAVLWVREGQ